jgi:hypothetical protein
MRALNNISLMGNNAETISAAYVDAIKTHQDLINLMNLYPIFTGVVLLIYFLIFTYIITLIHKGFYE